MSTRPTIFDWRTVCGESRTHGSERGIRHPTAMWNLGLYSTKKGNHLIIWGDAIEALSSKIPDASVDLIFTDPPYNIGKNFNGRK
jgi:hypothetical protein